MDPFYKTVYRGLDFEFDRLSVSQSCKLELKNSVLFTEPELKLEQNPSSLQLWLRDSAGMPDHSCHGA